MSINKFDKSFNYDDIFIRDVITGVISEFHRKLRWTNKWKTAESYTEKLITVPIYYSLTGNERYLLDAFVDDIIGERPDLNIDPIPRGHLVFKSASIKRNEISNPNVEMQFYSEDDGIIKKQIGRFKVLPLLITFSIKIELDNEGDLLKCKQSLWEWYDKYRYFYITHKSFRIDSIFTTPDDTQDEIQREIQGLKGHDDTKRYIEFQLDVHTFYPIQPKESKPKSAVCNKAIFKGRMSSLGKTNNKATFIGSNINCKK